MLLPTRVVAQLLNLPNRRGIEYAKRCMRDCGLRPVLLERDGRRVAHYTTAQTAAVKLYFGLKKFGIGQPFRVDLCGKIAALPDEALEAKLAAGERYLLKASASPVAVTSLLTLESIREYLEERKDNPTAPRVEVIDLGPAFDDLFQAVRTLTTAEGSHADA